MVEVLLYLLKIHILVPIFFLKIKMKQLRVSQSQLRKQTTNLKILFLMLSIDHLFQFRLESRTNKLTRITKDTISAIDYTIANPIINNEFKTSILTADISDHFPIMYAFKLKTKHHIPKTQFLYRCIIKENLIKVHIQITRNCMGNDIKDKRII